VAIHEATSAELPVICTWVCGASTRLVLDGYNGALVGPGRADELARAFRRISEASDDERRRMGQASAALSRQYSPARWADTLLRRIPELRSSTGMAPWSTPLRSVVAEKWTR
jgi:glycosyltransferase involved in cell wall biosynthesis